ncbi:unnamed protein product [Effrenium voratum]|nr:unnamed protein product [Effrenium voratum]
MCLLVGKPRAADLLKEIGDKPEISVKDFLDLFFDEAAQELGTTNEYAAQPSQELHGESPEVKALKQELEQTKQQLRAAQAKTEEKEQELQRLQKLDTKEQAEANFVEFTCHLLSAECLCLFSAKL